MLLKIGSITVRPGISLAPMAGITGYPFRLLAKEQGCPLLYSEMISARGLLYNSRRHCHLLYFTEEERPIGFQIFGSEPAVMAKAAVQLEALGVDFVDLNLGCPTPKVTRNGDGGALLRNPALCSEIFKAVSRAVTCPVTVKLRKGWDAHSVNVVDVALRAEEAGIKAVAVHGRTVEQGYSGSADWDIIAKVKESLSIPVIGNGDINSPQSAGAMFSHCGCDGVMIGRAARGNPWIFSSALAWLKNNELPEPPPVEQLVETALKHLSMLIDLKGERVAIREMRQHAAYYIKSLPGAAAVRQKINRASSYQETENILREFCRCLLND